MSKTKDNSNMRDKVLLSVDEAAEYFGLTTYALRKAIKDPNCPYVFRSGKRCLIKREALEEYIASHKSF